MTSWYWSFSSTRVFVKRPGSCFWSQSAPPIESVRSQAVQLIPSVQAAVRFYRKLEQAIQRFSPVWSRRERLSRTSAPCSSIALPSPRPE